MKIIAGIFFISILFCCTQKKNQETNVQDSTATEAPVVLAVKKDARKIGPAKSSEQLLIEEAVAKIEANVSDPVVGYWVGLFGKNKINIALAEVNNSQALGYTVCAGNYRPITGKAERKEEGVYHLIMDEPGTDQYDGHFEFTVNVNDQTLQGTWAPFKKNATSAKEYTLKKMKYVYQPGVGDFPDGSTRILSEQDVANMDGGMLEIMRNEIYARHGYSFKDIDDRRYFDAIDWYIPMGIDIRDKLTDVEVQNIDLIYRYEEYYKENYDSYGR